MLLVASDLARDEERAVTDRPAIPIEVQRDVLFQARHRCAVCCEPTPLERAHIRPWKVTHDHSEPNLIALCANCHGRADHEKWGEAYLRRYKQNPCALAASAMPIMSSEQKAMVDLILAAPPDSMNERQRMRLVSMVAAYANVRVADVQIITVSATNSTRVRIELPRDAAMVLLAGFHGSDPILRAFLEDFELLRMDSAVVGSHRPRKPTDTSERGLESVIVAAMGRGGWITGDPRNYDREYGVDLAQLVAFLGATKAEAAEALDLGTLDSPMRQKFLARLQGEITKRGVIDVLRKGIKHGPLYVELFYGTPTPGNTKAEERYAANRFSVTRQLRYSTDETKNALDLGAVHQWPADCHVRAQEQPDETDGGGRGRAVQARP